MNGILCYSQQGEAILPVSSSVRVSDAGVDAEVVVDLVLILDVGLHFAAKGSSLAIYR